MQISLNLFGGIILTISMSKSERFFDLYKITVSLLGIIVTILVLPSVDFGFINRNFLAYAFFAVLIGLQVKIVLPYTKVSLSLSDTIVYLAFLLYGGATAVLIAVLEITLHSIFGSHKNITLTRFTSTFNIGLAAVATYFAYFVWSESNEHLQRSPEPQDLSNLIISLGIFSLAHFFMTSILISLFYSLKSNLNPWQVWKNEVYSISLLQLVSAAIAGIMYKAIFLENMAAIIMTSIVLTIIFIVYRRSTNQLLESIQKAEQAERLRAEQAEKHIEELNARLLKEEEMTEALQQSKDAMEHIALHDSLTGLFNRFYLIDRLRFLLEIGINKSNRYFTLFIDLSGLKNINDSLGHNTGDTILKLVAQRMLHLLNEEDTVARIGGDEFAVILNDLSSLEEAEEYAKLIYQKLTEPFSVQENQIFIKPHIGIAPLDSGYRTPEEILRDADIAMHHAKDRHADIAVFDSDLRESFLEKIRLESELRIALERREFLLHYQPIISLANGKLVGFEALLRWQHPRRGFVSPAEFIPIAENSGLIIPITNWILTETTRQLALWQKILPGYSDLIMSVNISGKHLVQDGLVEEVKQALQTAELNPHCLKLEVTETVAMEHIERTTFIINNLKVLGVQFSIDDFGTGYSSLGHLQRLSFDNLKIDRSFISVVGEDGSNAEILQTIISLAKNLKMQAVAEGIETVSQLQKLRALDCEYAQGYLLSKPLPKEEMERLLYRKTHWFPEEILSADYIEELPANYSENSVSAFTEEFS